MMPVKAPWARWTPSEIVDAYVDYLDSNQTLNAWTGHPTPRMSWRKRFAKLGLPILRDRSEKLRLQALQRSRASNAAENRIQNAKLLELWKSGKTLKALGKIKGVTSQAIYQRLCRARQDSGKLWCTRCRRPL